MEAFGVDAHLHAREPGGLGKGAVVTNIAHIPAALTAVMALNGARPDFAPRGSLTLKPWMPTTRASRCPPRSRLPTVDGARALRRRRSRARRAGRRGDRAPEHEGQVGRVGDGPEDAGHRRARPLGARPRAAAAAGQLRAAAGARERRARTTARCSTSRWPREVNLVGDPSLVAADAARDAGNSPNTMMAAAAAIIGPKRVERALACTRALIDLFAGSGLKEGHHDRLRQLAASGRRGDARAVHGARRRGRRPAPEAMLAGGARRAARSRCSSTSCVRLDGRLSRDAILAAIATTIAWGPLVRKRISRLTAETLPWYLRLYGVMVGAIIPAAQHQRGSLLRHLAGRALSASGRWPTCATWR